MVPKRSRRCNEAPLADKTPANQLELLRPPCAVRAVLTRNLRLESRLLRNRLRDRGRRRLRRVVCDIGGGLIPALKSRPEGGRGSRAVGPAAMGRQRGGRVLSE